MTKKTINGITINYELEGEGKTIVFVTHSMGAVERFCTRAVWLHQGNIKMDGYHLVVTRGLARHAVPIPRIFNRPEITVIDLEGE